MLKDNEKELDLAQLYDTEAHLVQEKIGHILTIRSIALTLFAAILGAIFAYPGKSLEILLLILIPFYLLESTYDAYLIPIVIRETGVRNALADQMAKTGVDSTLSAIYRANFNHRWTPESWNPLVRALVEPLRIGLYLAMIGVPLVILYSPALLAILSKW